MASGLLLRYSCGQMRLATALAFFVCLADGFAQTIATLDEIRYPPLAAAAQVQGDVLISGGHVIMGHPLLREAALRGIGLSGYSRLRKECTASLHSGRNRSVDQDGDDQEG